MGGVLALKLDINLGFIPYGNIKGANISVESLGYYSAITNSPVGPVAARIFAMAFVQ